VTADELALVADEVQLVWNPAAGQRVESNIVPRHLTPNDGGKRAYPQNSLRMRIRRSLDGLQRRFAPCSTVTDQRGSYEIDGCG
jgi:hypothetical protein